MGHLSTYWTVPTGGWSVDIDTGGGPTTVTLPAGEYAGVEAVLTSLQTLINAAFTEDFTLSLALSETVRTGYVTIDMVNAGNYSLVWNSTDLRDALGFTGDLSGANSYTGTATPLGLWIPDCQCAAYYGNSDGGHRVVMMTQTRSGTGIVKTIVESSYVEHPNITWSHVSAPYARQDRETGGSVSFERWWYETQTGLSYAWFPSGSTVVVYTDSDSSSLNHYKLLWDGTSRMERVVPDWDYLYPVTIRGIVQ